MNENDLKPYQALEKRIFGNLKVALIGIIVSYDEVAKTANIQPIVKENFTNGKIDKLPILTNVFCVGRIPKVGELALVIFTDRNHFKAVKEYSYQEGTPFDTLLKEVPIEIRHNLSNGIAICGFINPEIQFTQEELSFIKLNYDEYKIKFIVKNWNILHKLIMDNGGVEPNEN